MSASRVDVNAIILIPHQTCIDLMNYLNCHRQRNNRSEITRQVLSGTIHSLETQNTGIVFSTTQNSNPERKSFPSTNANSTLRKAQLIHSDFERRCAFGRVIANDIHLTGFRNLR